MARKSPAVDLPADQLLKCARIQDMTNGLYTKTQKLLGWTPNLQNCPAHTSMLPTSYHQTTQQLLSSEFLIHPPNSSMCSLFCVLHKGTTVLLYNPVWLNKRALNLFQVFQLLKCFPLNASWPFRIEGLLKQADNSIIMQTGFFNTQHWLLKIPLNPTHRVLRERRGLSEWEIRWRQGSWNLPLQSTSEEFSCEAPVCCRS